MRERLDPPAPRELALAAVLTAVMTADLQQAASWALGLVLVLPAGLALAWRLVLPELPLALTCLAHGVLLATAPGEFGPQTVVLGVVVAVFTAGRRLDGRRALVAGAWSAVAVWVAHVASAEGDVDDFLPLVVWGAPWLAGRLVRRQERAASEAGARAALLEVEAREATARERDRIARELHDVVAHSVSLMVVQAGAERMALGQAQPRTRAALEAGEETGRQALGELRAMLGVLRDGDEEGRLPQPDLSGLGALVDSTRAAGLAVDAELDGDLGAVPPGPALAAYRVVQEALTNALRHGTGTATLRVVVRAEAVEVEVGNPIGPRARGGAGRGLLGMRERVEAYGGELGVGPDGARWRVAARVPL